jgi:hypothetical protein
MGEDRQHTLTPATVTAWPTRTYRGSRQRRGEARRRHASIAAAVAGALLVWPASLAVGAMLGGEPVPGHLLATSVGPLAVLLIIVGYLGGSKSPTVHVDSADTMPIPAAPSVAMGRAYATVSALDGGRIRALADGQEELRCAVSRIDERLRDVEGMVTNDQDLANGVAARAEANVTHLRPRSRA